MPWPWRDCLPIGKRRWRECRQCLPEVIPAVQHLWEKNESSRAVLLSYWGFATGNRIGELEIALRILQQYLCDRVLRCDAGTW